MFPRKLTAKYGCMVGEPLPIKRTRIGLVSIRRGHLLQLDGSKTETSVAAAGGTAWQMRFARGRARASADSYRKRNRADLQTGAGTHKLVYRNWEWRCSPQKSRKAAFADRISLFSVSCSRCASRYRSCRDRTETPPPCRSKPASRFSISRPTSFSKRLFRGSNFIIGLCDGSAPARTASSFRCAGLDV